LVADTWKLTVEVKESNKKDRAEIMTGNIDDDFLKVRIAGQTRFDGGNPAGTKHIVELKNNFGCS